MAHVKAEHIEGIAELYSAKWFDYRFMSPGHCFLYFTHCYHKAFKIAGRKMLRYRKSDQRHEALYGKGLMFLDGSTVWERDSGFIAGLWNAMVAVDSLCIPYENYIRYAFERALDTEWTALPRPAQLYNERMGIYCLDRWEEEVTESTVRAKHPRAIRRTPSYQEWLLKCLKRKTSKVRSAALLVREKHLSRSDLDGILNSSQLRMLDSELA